MSLLDANPASRPGAYWPDGFREKAQAIADKVAVEQRASAQARSDGDASRADALLASADDLKRELASEIQTATAERLNAARTQQARVIRTAAQVQADTGAVVIRRVRLAGARPMVPSRMTEDEDTITPEAPVQESP